MRSSPRAEKMTSQRRVAQEQRRLAIKGAEAAQFRRADRGVRAFVEFRVAFVLHGTRSFDAGENRH
jgi:hypothetical protein